MDAPRLVLGPLLRYVDATEATVWVETDAPCEVEVLGHTARTFHVEGHHYAIVHVCDLPSGESLEYEVALDGARVWPEPGGRLPPSRIRTLADGEPLRIVFGSCRVTAPHEPPYSLPKDVDPRGREIDALRVMADRMRHTDPQEWPRLLLLLGDQVYADEVSPGTERYIATRRDPAAPPGRQVADFQEYAVLYREAWSDPLIRWLLSTVPTAMIFDDHDVHDDWNTSAAWVEAMRATSWWPERITGAFMSYWIYQHLGNLSPHVMEADETYRRVRAADDAGPVLRDFAERADRDVSGAQWSFCRDIGGTRIVVMDSRAGRVLDPGRRSMVDDREWRWIVDHATGDVDHLLLGTTLPVLLGHGMHHLEAWNEAVCDGAWGGLAARAGERLRQALDLEHWAAFRQSFDRLMGLVADVGAGRRGAPPASIAFLSGDVHHAYLAEVGFPREAGVPTPVWQAVCSPFRNPLDARERAAIRFGMSRPFAAAARLLARSAGVPAPRVGWRLVAGPWFDNQVAAIDVDGREATLRLYRALPGADPYDASARRLELTFERALTPQTSPALRPQPSPPRPPEPAPPGSR